MDRLWRSQLVISVAALTTGIVGLFLALDEAFTSDEGEIIGGLGVSFNPLGAAVAIVLAGISVAGFLLRRRTLVLAAAVGYAFTALQVLVQFGRDPNWFGSRGSNLSFALAVSIGLSAILFATRGSESGNDDPTHITR
jgi:hypothetical protein